MNNRHRRRKWVTESKKNSSTTSITVAIISGVAIIYLLVCIILAINTGGEVPNFVGALGMLFFLGTIPCVVLGRNRFKMTNYNFISRFIGILIPAIAFAAWGLLYLFGLIFA
ncbi:MAG: hypothetical protein K5644_08185 [Lachnospiraceae bacterium]|nr:hypothetical protein [Lachnospiraceae bacterium]